MQLSVKVFFLSLLCSCAWAADFPQFEGRTLDPQVGKVCYAVTIADVNGDEKPDIVALTENRVIWFQSPTWDARVIIADQMPADHVCIAPLDIDGDGRIDFAVGAGWTKTGTLHWITRTGADGTMWKVHSIGEERWLHRLRFANVLGKNRPQLVISPLNATVGDGVRLTAFEIPADPVNDRWPSTVLNANFNRMHNHWHLDFDDDGSVDTMTASREGVHLVRRSSEGWTSTRLGTGAVADDPSQSGAGEIKVGRLKSGQRYIVTVEPMHGHSLVVYLPTENSDAPWERHVVDTGFQRGHAVWTADLDSDGADEIVFGHSDTADTFGVIAYDCISDDGTEWSKHVIDSGGMATEDLMVQDLTGDGKPDIVAGGRATHNVKLYVQQ